MNVKELSEQAWSLRPDQNPATMEFLGMSVRNGVRYRYYRDEGGAILYDSEPEEAVFLPNLLMKYMETLEY